MYYYFIIRILSDGKPIILCSTSDYYYALRVIRKLKYDNVSYIFKKISIYNLINN